MLGYRAQDKKKLVKAAKVLDTENLADYINWVMEGAVTKVKDQ
jgi:hypothetical protein